MANPNGAPIWFELVSPDPDRAQPFYEAVAGWKVSVSPMPEHGGYRLAGPSENDGVAGLMQAQAGMPTGWTIYFAAEDVNAMAERVKQHGGQVHAGPMDIPHVGRFAAVADPQGVAFSIMTGASPQDSTAFKQTMDGTGVGHGVWIELATPDPDAALDFYGKLFGWSKQGAMPMGEMGDYTFIGTSEEDRPGAIMSSATTGASARWNWYVEVPDIDAAVAIAKAKGGTLIQGPDEIPGGSFAANLTDAEGLAIGVVGPRK